ncbi:hypothetical protein [Serratia fonticola]|uniref:hypothetical protein n=1 Tax=Serratia fonticola TaxID=47917 RepID=UPI001ED95DAA|nr:hypothetical protein [Serratia fonticola]
MIRTTVPTERLKQLADPNMICKCSWDEYKSISAELLAVREAQPAGLVRDVELGGGITGCHVSLFYPLPAGTAIFTAPPAPALPDERHPVGGDKWGWDGEYNRGWNAYRAAILNHVGGSNEKVQPVFFIEIEGDDWINAGRIPGSTFDFNNLPDGINLLYAAPPAPALPGELLDAMAEVIRISDRDHEAWSRAKAAISACRAAMLQPVSQGYTLNSPVIQEGCNAIPNGQPALPDDYFSTLVNAARLAADKAMRKHPQPNYVLLKVAEEAGEVVQAGVHYAEGRMTWQDLEGEIVQLLAMLIRLVSEGDQVNGIKPPASCSTATLAAVPDEIDIFVDQVCGNLPAGHQQDL